MLDFAHHEEIRVPLEDAQAGAGAEIDALTLIVSTGIFCGVFQFPPQAVLYSGDGVAASDKIQFS